MNQNGKVYNLSLFKRVFSYASPYRKLLRITLFTTILLSLIVPLRPYLIQYSLDHYINSGDHKGLLNITFLLIFVLCFEGMLAYFNSYRANQLGQFIILDLRNSVYKHMLHFRLKYFDKTAVGTLMTRIISDIEAIADIFAQGILQMSAEILQLVIILIFMFYTDWQLALISISTLPLLIWSTYLFQKAVQAAYQEVRIQIARLNTFTQEHITGMSIVQIFNKEKEEFEKFRKINEEHKNAHIRSVWAYSVFFPVVEILSAISIGLVVWWSTSQIVSGKLLFERNNIVLFFLLIHMMYRPIRNLADRFNSLQMGMVSSERLFKVLDTKEFILNEGTISADKIEGGIQFKDVCFAYDDENWVLNDISFEVKKGQTIALVGATGSGKTSMINLLNRSYEINKGSICIDGIDIRNYDLHSLRKQIGVVLQDVFLFADSIKSNIALGNTFINEGDIIKAAQEIGVHEFIEKLPGKYDFNVMERGGMLSAGQRQLISFIRAYLHNPAILILDEATSSIDTETEILIQRAIERLTRNRTSLIIAHRLATIQKADKILVLGHGIILESGSHQELLQIENGQYRKLYELQFEEV
jgi:ATP-binding cassette subfamily B protein